MNGLQNWLAAMTILSLLAAGIFKLVQIVIQVYILLEQIKQSCLASDQALDERIDRFEYDLADVKKDVRDIRGVIKRFVPDSFRRVSDYEADHQKDRHPE